MFSCTIQRAGYDYDQSDSIGIADPDSFASVLDDFPWVEELEKYNLIQKGASATISLTNQDNDHTLWISIVGNKEKYNYLIGYVYYKTVKGFLGLGKQETKKWLDIYMINDLQSAKEFFALFFAKDHSTLLKTLQMEKRFDSMPARN